MKIKLITYAKTWQERQYEPERVEATAEIQEGEDPAVAFVALRTFVFDSSRTFTARKKEQTKKQRIEELQKEIDELEEEYDR